MKSEDRIQARQDLLEVGRYPSVKESEEATQEVIGIPGFIESFERGKKDIAEGRVANWRTIRSDV